MGFQRSGSGHRGAILSVATLLIAVPLAAAAVPTVTCPTDPPRVRRLQLQERWRIDPEDTDAPLLGVVGIQSVAVRGGEVYLLDNQLSHVVVYSADGRYLRTIMREGEGPGEVRRPGLLFVRDDGTLAVQHGYPSKLTFVAPDGTPRGDWRLRANAWLRHVAETPRGWFGSYSVSDIGDDPASMDLVLHVAFLDDEGEPVAEFARIATRRNLQEHAKADEADEYEPWSTAVAAGDGQVVLAAERDAYRLEWRDLDGAVTRVVTREFPAHRRADDELARLKYGSYSIVDGHVTIPDRRLCERDPVIRAIEPLPDGRLRVRTSFFDRELPPGMACRFEIHAPTGELAERVEIYDPTGAYDRDYDAIVLLDDGQAMVLRNLGPASRAAYWASQPQELREKLPPPPDDREDTALVPVMCDLVPRADGQDPGRVAR